MRRLIDAKLVVLGALLSAPLLAADAGAVARQYRDHGAGGAGRRL